MNLNDILKDCASRKLPDDPVESPEYPEFTGKLISKRMTGARYWEFLREEADAGDDDDDMRMARLLVFTWLTPEGQPAFENNLENLQMLSRMDCVWLKRGYLQAQRLNCMGRYEADLEKKSEPGAN